jgi:hypothetical protein
MPNRPHRTADHLREIQLQPGRQTITLSGFFIHHPASLFDEHWQRPGLCGVGLEPSQTRPMMQQQIEQDVSVVRIVLGAGRKQRRSKLSGRPRMNGIKVHLRIFAEHEHQRAARLFHRNRERALAES